MYDYVMHARSMLDTPKFQNFRENTRFQRRLVEIMVPVTSRLVLIVALDTCKTSSLRFVVCGLDLDGAYSRRPT